jgi:hypothetical protein
MSPIEDNMTDIIIERLHELGFKDTEGKSQRELIQILAAMDVKVDSPNNSWF